MEAVRSYLATGELERACSEEEGQEGIEVKPLRRDLFRMGQKYPCAIQSMYISYTDRRYRQVFLYGNFSIFHK
jgi:hypothetical protein